MAEFSKNIERKPHERKDFHEEDGKFHVERKVDVEPVARQCYELRKDRSKRFGNKQEFHHVARIPAVIVGELMRRGIFNDEEAFNKWLMSDEGRMWMAKPVSL